MPARDIDIWMPASFPPWMRTNFTWHDAQVVARLEARRDAGARQESMAALSLQVTAKDFRGPHSVTVMPLREEMAGKTQTALVVLLWASAALLLIACVNLANLLLSRGAARGREVAVRAALGAGRGRLVAQFLTESLVLAGLGAVAGLALAVPAMRFLETLVPETMGAVAAHAGLARAGVLRGRSRCRRIDFRACARAARVAARSAGRIARRRPRHGRRAQPLVPAFPHRDRDGPRRGAADERRTAAADLSTSAEHRPRHPQREAADLRNAAVPLSGLRPARGLRQRGVGAGPRDPRRDSTPARSPEFR